MQPVEAIVFRNVIIFPVQISSLPFPSPGWPTAKSKLIYSVIEAVMINEILCAEMVWNGFRSTEYSLEACGVNDRLDRHSITWRTSRMGWNDRYHLALAISTTAWWLYEESSAWCSFRFLLFFSPRYFCFFNGTKYQTRRSSISLKEVWRISLKG